MALNKKETEQSTEQVLTEVKGQPTLVPARKRGRPRRQDQTNVKIKKEVEQPAEQVLTEVKEQPAPEQPTPAPARKRGRPRRQDQNKADMLPLTVGMVLQQTRTAKHMKLASISKKLRIREVYLEALEEGNYQKFPALVYGVGFLKNYAAFLGLDVEEMVARFHRETMNIPTETADIPHNVDPRVIPPFKTWFKAVIALFLIYLCWNICKSIYRAVSTTPLPSVVEISEIVAPQPEVKTDVEAPVTADELTQPKKAEPKEAVKSTPLPPAPKRKTITYGLPQPVVVSLVATEKTWIEIRDTETDSVLLSKTLETGDRYNPVEDPDGMVLKTTNAGGLDVFVNGKKVKKLGKKGQTKAGIQLDAANLMKD